MNAVLAWQANTGTVAGFLNVAAAVANSDEDTKTNAAIAVRGQVDQLTHEKVLDSDVVSAHDFLVTGGRLVDIVRLLVEIRDNGR